MSFQARRAQKEIFFFKNRLLYLQNVPLFSLALAIIDEKVNHLSKYYLGIDIYPRASI